jgi:hypothetical protein
MLLSVRSFEVEKEEKEDGNLSALLEGLEVREITF